MADFATPHSLGPIGSFVPDRVAESDRGGQGPRGQGPGWAKGPLVALTVDQGGQIAAATRASSNCRHLAGRGRPHRFPPVRAIADGKVRLSVDRQIVPVRRGARTLVCRRADPPSSLAEGPRHCACGLCPAAAGVRTGRAARPWTDVSWREGMRALIRTIRGATSLVDPTVRRRTGSVRPVPRTRGPRLSRVRKLRDDCSCSHDRIQSLIPRRVLRREIAERIEDGRSGVVVRILLDGICSSIPAGFHARRPREMARPLERRPPSSAATWGSLGRQAG